MNRAPLRPARRGSPGGGSSAPRRLGRPLRRALPLGRALLLGLALAAPAAQTAGPVDPDEAVTAHSVLVLLPLPPEAAASAGGEHGRPPPGHAERHRLALQLARSHGLTLGEAWPVPAAAVDCYVMRLGPEQSTAAVAEALSRQPGVAWAQPMHLYRARGPIPPGPGAAPAADPLEPLQPAAREWRLAELHRVATGRDVRVAVIDSAVDARHPDLQTQIATREDFIEPAARAGETHGTAVAGLIAARAGNGQGIVGIAPQARLMALRACREGRAGATGCTTLALAKALQYALEQTADVINLSLAGPPDRLLAQLLDAARQHGAAVVAPRDATRPDGGFPASHPGVLSVVEEGTPPAGAWSAPGRDLPTTVPGGGWGLVSGPSYAAAQVSGLVALLRERQPRGDAPFEPVPVAGANGRLDACATLGRAAGVCPCDCDGAQVPVAAPAPPLRH